MILLKQGKLLKQGYMGDYIGFNRVIWGIM